MSDEIGPFTKTPNWFYDELLPQISTLAELKITEVVIRHTLGFHQEEKLLSISLFMEKTGLSSQAVRDGIDAALERGFVERWPSGQSFKYSFQPCYFLAQSAKSSDTTVLDSSIAPINNLAGTVLNGSTALGNDLATLKETPKETLKEKEKETFNTFFKNSSNGRLVPLEDARLQEYFDLAKDLSESEGHSLLAVIESLDAKQGGMLHPLDIRKMKAMVAA